MQEAASKYVGHGLYVGEWEAHEGPEGSLKREIVDMMYGPSVQFAQADEPEKFVGSYATFPEIAAHRGEGAP
jgi:hypothetical protein